MKLIEWLFVGIKWIWFVFVAFLITIHLYFWFTYKDEIIKEDGGYGFGVGQSKEEAFRSARNYYKDKTVYYLDPISLDGYGPRKLIKFTDHEFKKIKERKFWYLLFNSDDYLNSLRVEFDENDKVISIHRHEQAFELP